MSVPEDKMESFRDQGNQEGFQPVDSSGAPIASTDVDSDTGQTFTGTNMEPKDGIDPLTGKPSGILGRTDSTEPEPGQASKTVKQNWSPGNYGRNQRDEIYKNSKAERQEQMTDEDSPGADYLQQLEREAAGGEPIAPQAGETGDEIAATAKAIEQEQQQEQAGADGAIVEPEDTSELTSKEKYYYIKVDGADQIASAAEIREAGGVDNLQKTRSANYRLQDNATERRILDQKQAELDQRESEIVAREKVPPQGKVPTPDPSTAGSETGVKAADVTQVIYDGDSETAGEKLMDLIKQTIASESSTVAGSDTRQDKPVTTVVDGDRDPGQQPRQTRHTNEQLSANLVWNTNFSDLNEATTTRPEIMAHASAEMARRSSDPLNAGKALAESALDVGNDLRKIYMPPEGVSLSDVLSLDDAQAVVVSKRRLRGTNSAASATAHTVDARQDQKPNYGQGHQSAFAKLKKQRGQ